MRIEILLNKIEKINRFLYITNSFESSIDLIKGNGVVDAKSLLGIYSFDLSNPVFVEIHSVNEDETNRFKESMEEFRVELE